MGVTLAVCVCVCVCVCMRVRACMRVYVCAGNFFEILADCPQHVVLFNYTPQQADELALQAGDVVKVLRKMEDGEASGT